MQNLLHRRFDELDQQLETLIASIRPEYSSFHERMTQEVDDKLTLNWEVKAKSLLQAACGVDSQHLTIFVENETSSWFSSADILLRLAAVFRAAKEDFQGGYLESVRNLVRAEVFDSELEQSSELLKSGYFAAAAVICGTVLETAIRILCATHELELGPWIV